MKSKLKSSRDSTTHTFQRATMKKKKIRNLDKIPLEEEWKYVCIEKGPIIFLGIEKLVHVLLE